jgi:hypothetical protein
MQVGWLVSASVGLVCACGGVKGVSPPDASVDAALDASTAARCDRTKPFAEPTLAPGVNTVGADAGEAGASLTPDELTIYFTSNRLAPGTPNFDVYVASRASITDAFGTAQKVDVLDLGGDERNTWISPDELSIYIYSSGHGNYDLYVSTRTSKLVPFGSPQPLGVNTTDIEEGGTTTADGHTLYFQRGTLAETFRSVLGPNGFDTASPVAELNTPDANSPVPSGDDLSIYFGSSRGGTMGSIDIYFASRPSTTSPFNQITNVTELNSQSYELPTWISPDGCDIYFTSLRGGGFDVWTASRPR